MSKLKKYILNIKSRKIKEVSKIILKEKYNEFEKYINLFYDNKKGYIKEILKNKAIYEISKENADIYSALKNFAVYSKLGVLYYKADICDKGAEWNRTAEIFDFLFQDILSEEIVWEVLRKCFFTDKKYSIELFFSFISEVMEDNSLKMYFWDDGSDLLLFFILKKSLEIKYEVFLKFLSYNGITMRKLIYSIDK